LAAGKPVGGLGVADRAAHRCRDDCATPMSMLSSCITSTGQLLGEELAEKDQEVARRLTQAHRQRAAVCLSARFIHARWSGLMDTTILHFGGRAANAGPPLLQQGSPARSPAMILAVRIDGDGHPLCSEMWPGASAAI